MPVVINKSSEPQKKQTKPALSGAQPLSPAVVAGIIALALVLIGGVYFFLMRGSSDGPEDSTVASQSDGYGQAAPNAQPAVSSSSDGLPPVQNLPDNSNITKESGGPVTVPGK